MPNKVIKISIKDIEGLQSDGGYKLRYRIKSKDGLRKSEWSEIANLSYPINTYGVVSSFYELYFPPVVGYFGRPNLANTNSEDPHPSNGYAVSTVRSYISPTQYITSAISYLEDDTKLYTYGWTVPSDFKGNKLFDVYLSWKYTATGWSDWEYAGTTNETSFSFLKPDSTAQYVQAAVFLSSNPKLTNIFGAEGETTFISISPTFSTYQDVGNSTLSTVTTPSSGGKYFGTISSLAEAVPTGIDGRRVFSDTATFDGKKITVKSRTATTIVVESSTAFGSSTATTTLTNIRL